MERHGEDDPCALPDSRIDIEGSPKHFHPFTNQAKAET
jgi:hypothetical protein